MAETCKLRSDQAWLRKLNMKYVTDEARLTQYTVISIMKVPEQYLTVPHFH